MKNRVVLGAVTLCLLLNVSAVFSQGDPLKRETKIEYDKDNYLVFTDPGRVEHDGGFSLGAYVRLTVTRGGATWDWNLTEKGETSGDITPLINVQVYRITYMDKDHVWIMARGHRLSKAMLLNLETKQVDENYYGWRFSLSPDSKHIAFSYPYDRETVAVFVDEYMVYPNISEERYFDFKSIHFEENEKAFEKLRQEIPAGSIREDVSWRDKGCIEFGIDENYDLAQLMDGVYKSQSYHYTIEGLFKTGSFKISDISIQRKGEGDEVERLKDYDWDRKKFIPRDRANLFPKEFLDVPAKQNNERVSAAGVPDIIIRKNEEPFVLEIQGDEKKTLEIPRLSREEMMPPSTIIGVDPVDAQSFWVTSKFDKDRDDDLFQACCLYQMEKKAFEKKYYGIGVALSKDKKHVAYARQSMKLGRQVKVALFVDNCLVYPVIQGDFIIDDGYLGPSGTRNDPKKDWREYTHDSPYSKLVSRIIWKDEKTVEFVICENWLEAEALNDPSRIHYLHYTVRLTDGAGQDPQILVKEPIRKEELAKFDGN